MGISLNGLTPAGTYPGLIKTGDNTAISGTPKALSDGNGNNLPMEVSTTEVNFTNQLKQSGVAVPTAGQVAAKQDTLVSGTNIKTINGASVLGAGNIVTPSTPPSGVSGAIQFSNGSAFASDAANLFWDDTNNRLGVGTNAPIYGTQLQSDTSGPNTLIWSRAAGSLNTSGIIFSVADNTVSGNQYHKGGIFFKGDGAGAGRGSLILVSNTANDASVASSSNVGIALLSSGNNSIGTLLDLNARVGIRGSGSTSATTSLLVQNSAGTQLLKVSDNGEAIIGVGNAIIYLTSANTYGSNSTHTWFAPGLNQMVLAGTSNATIGLSIGKGTTSADASSILDLVSTQKGLLPPRGTNTQMNAIASPATGLVFYDTTNNKLCVYNATSWIPLH